MSAAGDTPGGGGGRAGRTAHDPPGVRRRMLRVGATQAVLLAPSLVLSLVGLRYLSLPDYAAWALLFALGSAAIVLDGGAAQLAQIHRTDGLLGTGELARLVALASVAPAVLTLALAAGWEGLARALLDGDTGAGGGRALALAVGAGTIVRAAQGVANGVLLGAGEDRPRLLAASAGALAHLPFLLLLPAVQEAWVLAAAYATGALAGLAAMAPALRRSIGPPAPRRPAAVGTRSAIAALSVSLTQLDRLLVAPFAGAGGLAAYDLASRLGATAKLACIMLSVGLTGEGARAAGRVGTPPAVAARRAAQLMIDRVALIGFLAVPPLAWALARLTKPELAPTALVLGAILATGHGLHATTAPLTAYLSGLRELGPELTYLLLACAVTLALAVPLGAWLGVEGIAAAVAAGLAVGSVWLRRRAARRLEPGLGTRG